MKMTHSLITTIKFPGINTIQLHHAPGKNSFRRFNEKMVMVIHLNVTVTHPFKTFNHNRYGDLEKKLKALVKADIINQGASNYRYRGVNDNIFDKVFRGVYEEEIREFDVKMISKEYREELEKLKEQYNRLLGRYSEDERWLGTGKLTQPVG
jgi:hypothetical protein